MNKQERASKIIKRASEKAATLGVIDFTPGGLDCAGMLFIWRGAISDLAQLYDVKIDDQSFYNIAEEAILSLGKMYGAVWIWSTILYFIPGGILLKALGSGAGNYALTNHVLTQYNNMFAEGLSRVTLVKDIVEDIAENLQQNPIK